MVSSSPLAPLMVTLMPSQNHTTAKLNSRCCPYHAQVLSLKESVSKDTFGKDVMDRFLSEGPNESGAVFTRPDNNKLSIDKGCTCGQNAEAVPKL